MAFPMVLCTKPPTAHCWVLGQGVIYAWCLAGLLDIYISL